jgi:rod shape-determining protein MreC
MSDLHKHRIFAKNSSFSWAFFFLFGLSVLLISIDHQRPLTPIRWGLSFVVAPIQYTVDYPQRLWRWVEALVSSKTALVQENMKLRYQQALLEAKLQHFLVLKAENSQLKALLRSTSESGAHAIAAQILDVEASQVRQLMVLDKGWRDGVREGQAVLDAKGVMGQIIDVGHMTSTVLLISDAKSAVPVRNHRTGEWAMLMGANQADNLVLLNLPQTSQIHRGDVLVTSGLGGHYPQGYPIGRVAQLRQVSGEPFIQVAVRPIARLNQSHLVLVLLDDGEQSLLIKQMHARLNALGVLR